MSRQAMHYETMLARQYTWLYGGMTEGVEGSRAFFAAHGIDPRAGGEALDLGCGSGFQSLALARRGFTVTAIDTSPTLLAELARAAGDLPIRAVNDDLLRIRQYAVAPELIVCMGDTLTHLETRGDVETLLTEAQGLLRAGGRLILSYRDLSAALPEGERLIPVRQDEERLFLCFVENIDDEYAGINDIVVTRAGGAWNVEKGYYRKLRLPLRWVTDALEVRGFRLESVETQRGFSSIVAVKA